MGRCIVYTRNGLLLLIRPFISAFFFLSNFQTLKLFVTFFSGTVRPRRLKLCTHMDSGQMFCIYQNQAAAAYSSLYFLILLSLQFSNINISVTIISGTVRPRRLKRGTQVHSWQKCSVYRIRLMLLFVPLFFIFLSLQFSNFTLFRHTFLRNFEA